MLPAAGSSGDLVASHSRPNGIQPGGLVPLERLAAMNGGKE